MKTTKSFLAVDFPACMHKLTVNEIVPSTGPGRSMAHSMTTGNPALPVFFVVFWDSKQSFRDNTVGKAMGSTKHPRIARLTSMTTLNAALSFHSLFLCDLQSKIHSKRRPVGTESLCYRAHSVRRYCLLGTNGLLVSMMLLLVLLLLRFDCPGRQDVPRIFAPSRGGSDAGREACGSIRKPP